MDPGTVVAGRYLLHAVAGQGGMGRIFRAEDLVSQTTVAIKVLTAQGRPDRFLVEGEALASLDQDTVVRYLGHGVADDGSPYLVMEWLDGDDLSKRLATTGLLLQETLALAERLVLSLEYIHRQGIIHRDIKPSNVVLRTADVRSATLVDFGIARMGPGRALTASDVRIGTLYYMAPEQYLHRETVDGRADVFALGCVLFECLTGRRALHASDDIVAFARLVLEEAPAAREIRPEIPQAMSAFVARLLARDRTVRPLADAGLLRDVRQLAEALRGVEIGRPVPTLGDVGPTFSATQADVQSPPEARPVAVARPLHSLPRLYSSLVGRDDEIGHLAAILSSGVVVTLWGPAGIGKTRLALEAAHRWTRDAEANRAVFVQLRPAKDEAGVLAAIAVALHVATPDHGTNAEVERVIVWALRVHPAVVVVLDGAEHVAAIVEVVLDRLREATSEARFVVTSRQRPKTGVVVEVPPLSIDGDDAGAPKLFRERAGAVASSRDPELPRVIHRIVRILDGNPLAIELAAARVDILGLTNLAERLAKPLEVLRGVGRAETGTGTSATAGDLVPLTMDEALSWSWDLLAEDEKLTLACCSLFRGSFAASAAEAVVRNATATPVLDLLQALRDKSLLVPVHADKGRGSRLTMCVAVREYAYQKLDDLGLTDAARARHAQYFAQAGAMLASSITISGDAQARSELSLSADDLAFAIDYAAPRSAELTLLALTAWDPIVTTRGALGDYPTILERALADAAAGPPIPADLLGLARQARGRLLTRLGRLDEARADLVIARDAARASGDQRREASALLDLGVFYQTTRELQAARVAYETVVGLDTGSVYVEARALGNLGTLHHDQGRFDDAYACYVEAIALFESLSDPRPVGLFLANLAMLDRDRGRFADAARRFDRAVRHLEAARDPRLLGIALGSFGMLELQTGRHDAALAHHERAYSLLVGTGDVRSEALALGRLSASRAALGALESATATMGKGERLARRDPVVTATLGLLRAFLDVARAGEALGGGRGEDAHTWFSAARERMRAAEVAPPGGEALAAHSDDARAAIGALQGLLESS